MPSSSRCLQCLIQAAARFWGAGCSLQETPEDKATLQRISHCPVQLLLAQGAIDTIDQSTQGCSHPVANPGLDFTRCQSVFVEHTARRHPLAKSRWHSEVHQRGHHVAQLVNRQCGVVGDSGLGNALLVAAPQ